MLRKMPERYDEFIAWLKSNINSLTLEEIALMSAQYSVPFNGMLGNAEILAAIKSGQVVCDPFDPDLLKSNSYDLRLGGWFFSGERVGHRVDFSPYDEDSVKNYYRGPLQAITHEQWCEEHERRPFKGIDLDEYIIVLAPGECILAHTIEYIGARYGATTMMKARSSLGRVNISACDDAGSGDVNYCSRWTMEVRNKNQHVWVPLVCGMPIAQMLFFWVAGATVDYGKTGHYQLDSDISIVKASWGPSNMLPRLFSEGNKEIRQRISKDPSKLF